MAKFNLITALTLEAAGFNQGIDKARRSAQSFTDGIKGVGGGLLKVLGPIGLGIGALDTLKNGIMSVEGASDTLEETVGLLKGGFAGFFEVLFTGDWANLITNINNTAVATKNLKRAKDELAMIKASNSIKIGYYERELQAARLAAAETTDPKIKAMHIQSALEAQRAISAIQKQDVEGQLRIQEDFFQIKKDWINEEREFNIKAIREIAGNYEYYFGENSIVLEGLKKNVESLEYKKLATVGGLTDVQEKELRQTKLLIGSLETFQSLQDGMEPEAFKEYITTIATFNAVVAAGDADLVKLQKSLTAVEAKVESGNETMKEQIRLQKELNELKALKQQNTAPTKIDISLTKSQPNKLREMAEIAIIVKTSWQDTAESIGQITMDMAGAFRTLGDAITQAAEDGSISFAEAMNIISQSALAVIPILQGLAIAGLISKESSKGIIGIITAVAGIAMIIGLFAKFANPKKMSAGGLVYDSSIVNVGEYAGARTNPEVIAPLSTLKSMLGGTNSGEVVFTIKGDTLVGVLNNQSRRVNSFR